MKKKINKKKQYLVVANWKCNPATFKDARRLFNSVKRLEAVICPPFVYLSSLMANCAQDVFYEQKGAFTGEVSPLMLKSLGVQYVILGHSERRRYFGETDKMINKKIKAALKAGLKPIVCIANLKQLADTLKGITKKVIVAFEPISAIGTDKPYPIEKAKKMRKLIKHPFVLYGGSVNSKNAADYIKKAGFQGLLVGGASLDANEFTKIVKSVMK